MCGIAGWVDFDRDLTLERRTAQAMTDTMACRGPDAEGLWLAPQVALGHRRLAVIDVDGGRQPMTAAQSVAAEDPEREPAAVITYSGEVYNFRELREELRLRGRQFRTRSDTEVVLQAYLEWGIAFVHRLVGMYALAIWDTRSQELVLVRDRFGVKPLYYYPLAKGALFGSEPKAILAHPLPRPMMDAEGMRALLQPFAKTPGVVPFRGMRELRPGHVLRVRHDHLAEQQYWGYAAGPHADDLPTTVAQIRGLLENIVTQQLVSDVPLCTLLSGGLDSSAVTALAQRAFDRLGRGEKVRSFAVDFVGYGENFRPDHMRDTPDLPYAHDLASHAACDHHDIVLSTDELCDPGTRATVLGAWDLAYNFGDVDISLYLLFRAIRENSTVALSGEGADELFGGYFWFHDPVAVEADTFPWRGRPTKQWPSQLALFDPGVLEGLRIQEYLADQYRDALAEVPHLDGETGPEHRMRNVSYLNLTRFLPMMLDRKDRMSMAVGLEVRVPFCDHRLVEYVWNTPWTMKTFDGREKSLLREAVKDLLPTSVAQRRKTPYPAAQDTSYDLSLRDDLAKLLTQKDAPVLPLVDREAAHALVSMPDEQATPTERRLTETMVRLNLWLERYRVELVDI